jgi:hypothetical protein
LVYTDPNGRVEMKIPGFKSTILCTALALFIPPGCNGNSSSDAGHYYWLVTYDLTGSTYVIDALADFTITVQEPYDENLNMGPGSLVLRFIGDDSQPGPGEVDLTDYSLRQNFVTGISLAEVTTDIQTTIGPNHHSPVGGQLVDDTLTWYFPGVDDYCRNGQVSCTGSLCGTAGSPPEGDPFVFDHDCTEPLPLNPFVFTNGVSNFTMEAVTISQDSNQTTKLSFVGTETDREGKAAGYMF